MTLQVICLPIGPRCDLCLLGQRKICPSRVSNVKAEGRKEVNYTFTAEEVDDAGARVTIGYEEDVKADTVDGRGFKEEEDALVKPEPNTKQAEERVLEILDQVDGPTEIGHSST